MKSEKMSPNIIKPKLLILGPLPPPFMGPSVATEILINSDLKNFFDIYHINTSAHTKISELGKFQLSSIIKNFSLYYKYFSTIYKNKPDLILIPISQTTLGFLKDSVYIIIAKLFKIRFLVQLRGSNWSNWLNNCHYIIRIFVHKIMRMADGGILLSKKLKYLFNDYYSSDFIFCIPNGRDFKNTAKKQMFEDEKIKLLYVGNFIPGKGVFDVIQSLKFLDSKLIKNLSLVCVGNWIDDSTKKKYMNFVKQYGLPVSFRNNTYGDDKYLLFHESSIFIFTPRDPEGHPWVIVEALAYSLPIISTNKGAISDCVIDKKNGFIVKSNSPKNGTKNRVIIKR